MKKVVRLLASLGSAVLASVALYGIGINCLGTMYQPKQR